MLVLLSPSKTMDFSPYDSRFDKQFPEFIQQTLFIARQAKQWREDEISKIMSVSKPLASQAFDYFQNFNFNVDKANQKQALFAFNGDAYQGMNAKTMSSEVVDYTNQHLLILSGLYGVLRPLDLIQAHRFEMGLKVKIGDSTDLYHFWSDVITQFIRKQLDDLKTDVIVNLASVEYSKVVDFKSLGARVITPSFYNYRNGEYKMVSFWAKRARGMMTRFIMENRIENPDDLIAFDQEYYYEESLSKLNNPIFVSHK